MENKPELERVRSNFGLWFGGVWEAYEVDAELLAPLLSKYVSRDDLKESLGVLSEDFKNLFKAAPLFKTTKEENRFYFKMLKSLYNKGLKPFKVDKEGLYLFTDELYYNIANEAEDAIYKAMDYAEACKGDSIDYIKALRNVESAGIAFYRVVDIDAKVKAEAMLDSIEFKLDYQLKKIITYLDGYYTFEERTDSQRKQEQRLRDLLFCYIVIGLCYYYDSYLPVNLKDSGVYPAWVKEMRKDYSILEIILLNALLKDENYINNNFYAFMIDSKSDYYIGDENPLKYQGLCDTFEAFNGLSHLVRVLEYAYDIEQERIYGKKYKSMTKEEKEQRRWRMFLYFREIDKNFEKANLKAKQRWERERYKHINKYNRLKTSKGL